MGATRYNLLEPFEKESRSVVESETEHKRPTKYSKFRKR
jgi:hypothetical protein